MEIGESKSLKSEINVTPLVDVMLVMLIIFMLVTPMLQKGVGVSLPQALNVHPVSENEEQVLVVALTERGQVYLGKDPIDRTKLEELLRARFRANSALQLQIKADRNVPFRDIKAVVRAGREVGFAGAALIAEEIKEELAPVGAPAAAGGQDPGGSGGAGAPQGG